VQQKKTELGASIVPDGQQRLLSNVILDTIP
jgi:hypothetical protein